MRQKTVRLVQVVEKCGIFGKCLCGGDVLFYSDSGVRCKDCGKLYGTWSERKRRKPRRSKSLLKSEDGENIKIYGIEPKLDLTVI